MAIPTIDWEYWSQATIEPKMRAVVHFPSGDKAYTSEKLLSISFDGAAFDSTYTLFGTPSPMTGTIEFVDYEQELNPTNNEELTEGIQIDLYLGLNGYYGASQLGENLVSSVEDAIQVTYGGDITWAIPFWVSEVLKEDTTYRLSFDYVLTDGTTGSDSQIGTADELFDRPASWPDYTHLAVVYPEQLTVTNFAVQELESLWQPYGVFYSEEWSYDSSGCTATVEIVDGMNELLLLDNRADSTEPSENYDLKQFLIDLITLNAPEVTSNVDSLIVPYVFYETSQSTTINNIVMALAAMLFYMPDGSPALSKYSGLYETGITLTDDDVYSYSIEQTSAITMDSASVSAMLPENTENTELINYTNLVAESGDQIPFSVGRIMSVDYIATAGSEHVSPTYTWDVAKLAFDPYGAIATTFTTFKAYGHAISASALPIYNILGTLPYEITDNYYIQTIGQAQTLVDALDDFIALKYRVITVTLRGCYGIWLGAIIDVNSTMYNIVAKYVVINLKFSYDGAVSTTLLMQRI